MFASSIVKYYKQSFKCLDISTGNESYITLKVFSLNYLGMHLKILFEVQLSGSLNKNKRETVIVAKLSSPS